MPLTPKPERPVPVNQAELSDLRLVHRAAAELRRGAPVLLHHGAGMLAVLAAETADEPGLAELIGLSVGPPTLVLAQRRVAAVLDDGSAPADQLAGLAIVPARLATGVLRSLADPTAVQLAPETLRAWVRDTVMPPGSDAAVRLAKIARLLPTVLVAPVGHRSESLLSVSASAIDAYPQMLTAGLHRVAEAAVPLAGAPDARVIAFRPLDGGIEHLAIVVGHPEHHVAPLVRLHSACLTGDILGSLRCDCGPQLHKALARIGAEGAGVLLYLAQEGRGIGIVNKLRAYAIQDRGEDTVDANLSLGWAVDERSFVPAAIMLEQLGLRRVRLLTNNPAKVAALTGHGIEVVAREPHVTPANGVNDAYLNAKATRLGHLLG